MPGFLDVYRAKRSADRTPEPFGASGAARPRLFCVQKHAARRLHYDFRLEWNGVLLSWAVPHGPSPDPADKRLAMRVEDHPVEYADFEGVIPEGNYGAGPVIVWDLGRWAPVGDFAAGLESGKLLFELFGRKLRGVWTLVRMKQKRAGSGAGAKAGFAGERRGAEPRFPPFKGETGGYSKEWLLIKERDAFVAAGGASLLPPQSILSGRTVEDVGAGRDRSGEVRALAAALGAEKRVVRAKDVELMLADTGEPFSAAGWLFELKHDGYRVLAAREDGRAKILYRKGSDATALFPEVARALEKLPLDCVLDGELVVLDERGASRFQRLQQRGLLSRRPDVERAAVELPATLFAFDALAVEDRDLRALPLVDRKRVLQLLAPPLGPLRYVEHVEARGEEMYAAVRKLGLEGVMAKRADGRYLAGRRAEWKKLRVARSGDFAVVGCEPPRGGQRGGFASLHLALRDGERWVYAGRVGSGFSEAQLTALRARIDAAEVAAPPCEGAPKAKGSVWCAPTFAVEVRYREVTDHGLLRQPTFLRLRDDKRVEDCVRDDAMIGWGTSPPPPAGKAVGLLPPGSLALTAQARDLVFTNLGKVFWPEDGFTKGDLIDYYRAIAPWLLPYLRDRPLVMTRFPDGIHGKSFFQKDAPAWAPPWLRTVRIWSEQGAREIDYFLVDDVDALLYVANLASIPLHVWASRATAPERPDWCILDLDPKGAPLAHVVRVARAIHALCDALELPAYPKTSGQQGLHVLIPLGGQASHEQSRQLGGLLASVIARELPDLATTARALAERGGRVYLDYLQNGHGKTIASPYSARPVLGATCSAPLRWSDVGPKLDLGKYTLKTLPARMEKLGRDPLLPALTGRPDLARAVGLLVEREKRGR